VFKNLKDISQLAMHLDSVGNFYHEIGIGWMAWFENIIIRMSTGYSIVPDLYNYQSYTYPDVDLCLFAQFPQNRSILLTPYGHQSGQLDYLMDNETVVTFNCTNTLRWLGRSYSEAFPDVLDDQFIIDYQLAYNNCFGSNLSSFSG
jgi:hypothetical protein